MPSDEISVSKSMICTPAEINLAAEKRITDKGSAEIGKARSAHLGWLANFLADGLPLVVLILLDGIGKSLTLAHKSRQYMTHGKEEPDLEDDANEWRSYLVFSKFCIVHILRRVSGVARHGKA